MFSSETYSIEDCLYYSDSMTKITTNWAKDTSVSGRTIYKLLTNYQSDVELSFKLRNSIPSNFIIGFGYTGGNPAYWAKCMFFNENNKLEIFSDNNVVDRSNPSKTINTVYKLTTSNLHSISCYVDDVLIKTQSTSSSHPLNLRVDDFGNVLDIEYLKVKPL